MNTLCNKLVVRNTETQSKMSLGTHDKLICELRVSLAKMLNKNVCDGNFYLWQPQKCIVITKQSLRYLLCVLKYVS